MTYALHPLCELFPRLSGAEFDALRNDIQTNGLRIPITLYQGMVLDGGNRYRACLEAGVEPRFVEYVGEAASSYAWSMNGPRRHLTPGQSAAIVAALQDWDLAQQHGGDRRGDQAATLPLETVKTRAAESGASERTQRMADKVAKADPALARQVAHGEVSLPKALATVEKKPKKEKRSFAPPPVEDDIQDIRDGARALADENEQLQQRLAVVAMDATPEERAAAQELISELRARVNTLENENDAIRSQRDAYMVENAALKRQCESLLRKIKKAGVPA
jgi:FtsZ-binding cell division protein ZapB